MARWKWGFVQWLALVSVVALVVRVGYVLLFRTDIDLGGDSYFYSVGADLLVAGRGFIEPASAMGPGPVEQSASHPPLYLLWLAVASFVDPTAGSSQLVHMLWSCVLGTGTVIVCGLVGREVVGPRCGIVAAALAALYPNMWVHDGMLLSETMALFTTAMVILLAYRFWNLPSGRRAAWLGLWCGLATLSRAELVLTLPLVLVPLVLLVRAVPPARRLRWLAAGGTAAAVVMAPWVAFNLSRFEEPVYFTHAFGFTFAAANCDATYHGTNIGFKDYNCVRDVVSAASLRPGMDPSERENAVRREALRYARANRDRLPVVVAARWGRITGLFRPQQDIALDVYFLLRERRVAESTMYSYYVVAVLAIGGALVLRRRRVPVFPLVAFPAIVLVAVALTFSQSRYRAPAEAALVVLAAVAIDLVIRRMVPRRGGREELAPTRDRPDAVSASAAVPVQDRT